MGNARQQQSAHHHRFTLGSALSNARRVFQQNAIQVIEQGQRDFAVVIDQAERAGKIPVAIGHEARAAVAQARHSHLLWRGSQDTQVGNDSGGIARGNGTLDAILEQNRHIGGIGGDGVGRWAADIDHARLIGVPLVIEIGGVLGDIGDGARAQRDNGTCSCSHLPMLQIPQDTLNMIIVGMHQPVLIAFQPDCALIVAGHVQQIPRKAFQVHIIAQHRRFVQHKQDARALGNASALQNGG